MGVDSSKVDIKLLKSIKGHKKHVRNVIYFGKPFYRFVSGSVDGTIRIWNSNTFECEKIFTDFGDDVTGLNRWKRNQFVACSFDKTTRVYSIERPFNMLFQIECPSWICDFCEICNDERLIVKSTGCKLSMISYEKRKECFYGSSSSGIVTDRREEFRAWEGDSGSGGRFDSVWVETKKHILYLVDSETQTIKREFSEHENGKSVRHLSSYVNDRNHEILVATIMTIGWEDCSLVVYNTSRESPPFLIGEIGMKKYTHGILPLAPRFCIIGNMGGQVSIHDLFSSEFTKIKKKSFSGRVNTFTLISVEEERDVVQVVASSESNGNLGVLEISGLKIRKNRKTKKDMDEEVSSDLLERIKLLGNDFELFVG